MTYDLWVWYRGSGSFPEDADVEDVVVTLPKDPEDLGEILYWSALWVPIDVEEYLDDCDFGEGLKAKDNQVTVDYDKERTMLDDDYQKVSVYNQETGALERVRYLNDDDDIVLEYEVVEDAIPSYPFSYILVFTIIGVLGIVYIQIKKR